MKRKLVICSSIVLVVIISVFAYFKEISGWLEFKSNNYTSKEFKTMAEVSKKQYSIDSLTLESVIRDRIANSKEPYDNNIVVNGEKIFINDSLTRIYIDSIFYSPNFKEIAFLVIVENENKKLYKGMVKKEVDILEKHGNLPYNGMHFDGSSFIAKRKNNSFEIYFYGHSFTNSKSYRENSVLLRQACLNGLGKSGKKEAIYNFDDKRFWCSDVWESIR